MEIFRQKSLSLLKNTKFQCYQTSGLFCLLSNEDFRNAVASKLETSMPLLEQYLVNAHVGDNRGEDWLYKLACTTDQAFSDAKIQHDAAEFLDRLLSKLDLPSELYESIRHVTVKCQSPKCAKTPDTTYMETESRSGKFCRFVDL